MKAVPLNRYLVFFSIVVVGCAVDLATKSWIFGRLGAASQQTEWIWRGVFGLRTDLNQGALFGMGRGWAIGFAGLSAVAAGVIVYWLFCRRAAHHWLLCIALGSVTAGILGNLYDRLALHGLRWSDTDQFHQVGDRALAVRDWILVMIGDWPWPTFNIADSLLVCGAVLLLWHAFATAPQTNRQPAEG
jgi:signal peptidase II